jgi:enoyl-CoA hydratase/carnithine racemase
VKFDTIIFKKEERIATITLNRPEVLNAVNDQMVGELHQAIRDVAQDDEVRVVVIKGAGRGFCSGGDFSFQKVRAGKVTAEKAEDVEQAHEELRKGKFPPAVVQLTLALQRLDKPTIAMVNGVAVGLGFDLASACDMRIGCPESRFMLAFIKIGLPPDTGGTWLMPRIIGLGRALEYILTGDFCDAEDAYRIGLLNRLVPADRLEEETMKLAHQLAKGPPIAHRLSKQLVYKGLETDLETALAHVSACAFVAASSEDHKEGIKAFAEKRPPEFNGR